MQNNPNFYMKVAQQIKGFYLTLPSYVTNYTDFNCGHMAAHYTANELQADEIHMYGLIPYLISILEALQIYS